MKKLIVASAAVLALSGCASIFNGPTQAVTIQSAPTGASVVVSNKAGEKIHAGKTPVTLTLKRGAGYFQPEVYKLVMTKEGFGAKEMTITGTLSGWYIGNLLIGGVIGMLAVDPVTGAMYAFPETVSGTLVANGVKTSSSNETLTIVSTASLSPEQMKNPRPLASATN
jgi:uncharacterized protein YceK